jgi:hypothetical protein
MRPTYTAELSEFMRLNEYEALFDRCDREKDYATAWKFFGANEKHSLRNKQNKEIISSVALCLGGELNFMIHFHPRLVLFIKRYA